jgi:hypothetical protein
MSLWRCSSLRLASHDMGFFPPLFPIVMARVGAKTLSFTLLQLCASPPGSNVGETLADPAHTTRQLLRPSVLRPNHIVVAALGEG